MENFVERAAALLARALEYVSPLVAFAVCAGLAVFAALLQVFAARAATSVIGDSRRVKRFVVRRGEIVSSNAHRFYNKCVRRMGRRIRRAWKKHALCGREYAGSALKFEMDRRLGKERRPRRIYLPFAFAAVAVADAAAVQGAGVDGRCGIRCGRGGAMGGRSGADGGILRIQDEACGGRRGAAFGDVGGKADAETRRGQADLCAERGDDRAGRGALPRAHSCGRSGRICRRQTR